MQPGEPSENRLENASAGDTGWGASDIKPRLIPIPSYAARFIETEEPDEIKNRLAKLEALFERVDLQEKAKLDLLEHKVKELQQSLTARESYGKEVWSVTKVWLLFIGFFLIADATAFFNTERPIVSDNVMLAILTTTTVTVLALFTIVAKYFFPNAGGGDSAEK